MEIPPCPPALFSPTELTRTLLDIAYWVNRAMPRKGVVWPIGIPAASRGAHIRKSERPLPPPAPSVAAAVAELTSACTFAAELPFITMAPPPAVDPLLASVVAQTIRGVATVPAHPPAAIPISGALHDNSQLIWNSDGKHLCASGADCVAGLLPGAPGPLPIYAAPNQDRADVEEPAFCLICMRTDAAAVCNVASKLATTSEHAFGMVPVVLPPFQNLVSCADGYYPETLGVTPSQDVFSPVSIVGPDAPVTVEYNCVNETWYIDQSQAIWKPDRRYLNGNVPAGPPAPGWHGLQKQPGIVPRSFSR